MTDSDMHRLDRRASLLKSLAHPSRLLIIEMLERSPRCVGELTEAIGSDITTVSKHLAVLKRAGPRQGYQARHLQRVFPRLRLRYPLHRLHRVGSEGTCDQWPPPTGQDACPRHEDSSCS